VIDRNAWNTYHRPDRASPWQWLSAGATYGEAAGAGLLRQPTGERTVIFGRCLPDIEGRPVPISRRPR
jgi:hypothetical protein